MELTTFVTNFAAQFEDTAPDTFEADTQFRNIEEWDSLVALSIIAMADEEYGVKLTGDDIRNASTVQDIFEVIKAKQG